MSPALRSPLLLLLPPLAGCAGAGPPQGQQIIELGVDWASPARVASTASTVEVDVMPFLGRTPEGGPFDGYFEALSNLGSDFVRYAPCALPTTPDPSHPTRPAAPRLTRVTDASSTFAQGTPTPRWL